MLANLLIPAIPALQIVDVRHEERQFTVIAQTTSISALCPSCQEAATGIHSRYQRKVADLPWAGEPIQIRLDVRRFFCRNAACKRRVFCERLAPSIAVSARRTKRMQEQLQVLSLAMGGELTSRILPKLGMAGSPAMLLERVRQVSEPSAASPRVLGVDDWAQRKGQVYGTILVDLEQGSIVDLLADRTAATLAAWLKDHPSVEIITRDRFANYAEGATQGAPNATQVADRFHLLQNLNDALRRMLDGHSVALREAAETAATQDDDANPPLPVPTQPSVVEILQSTTAPESRNPPEPMANRPQSRSALRFESVKELMQQGLSHRTIAKRLGIDRRTVRRYAVHEDVPVRTLEHRPTSTITPFLDFLHDRLNAGFVNRTQLYLEVKALGFTGGYHCVWRALQQYTAARPYTTTPAAPRQAVQPLSSRQVARLLVQMPNKLTPEKTSLLDILLAKSAPIAAAYKLAQSFYAIVRTRSHTEFDAWLDAATQSGIAEFRNFAQGLQRDYAAVKAAVTLAWSNGPVEGQVNRLKLVKRQMYGRAKLDLLRQRLLHPM